MKLVEVLNKILKEIDDGLSNISSQDDSVLEFPNQNFSISVFRDEKKLLFAPIQHQSIPSKTRTFINNLKQNFRIKQIVQKDLGSFEVVLDEREDLDSVLDYIKQEIETDPSL
jgi:hypothetical protein